MFAYLYITKTEYLTFPSWLTDFCPEALGSKQFINQCHDDFIKWKHFPRYWPFVCGIHRWPAYSPHKGQRRGALMFSLTFAWINGWVNNIEAGGLRHHRTHYDVTVMIRVVCSNYIQGQLVLQWRHNIETLAHYWPFVMRIYQLLVESLNSVQLWIDLMNYLLLMCISITKGQ